MYDVLIRSQSQGIAPESKITIRNISLLLFQLFETRLLFLYTEVSLGLCQGQVLKKYAVLTNFMLRLNKKAVSRPSV